MTPTQGRIRDRFRFFVYVMWEADVLRVLLEMSSMGDPPEEEGAEGDVDHCLGDVEALLVVSHEASPAHHPSEGSLHNPTTGQEMETCGCRAQKCNPVLLRNDIMCETLPLMTGARRGWCFDARRGLSGAIIGRAGLWRNLC